jgi:hypothetical protein
VYHKSGIDLFGAIRAAKHYMLRSFYLQADLGVVSVTGN